MGWGFYGGFFPRSRPRAAKGGIKSQSKRGAFGESWWAERWVAVLEGFHIGARLQRGRSYARRGQVLSIDVGKGKITARVQGSRLTPYAVTIAVRPLARESWRKVAAAVARQAVFASKLLAGEMPREMEAAFRGSGASLFPARFEDLETNCSCPDWSNPCKHIAAVYYLLGEEFDRDPFLIFRMRGMSREEFLKLLGEGGAGKRSAVSAAGASALPPEPLPAAVDQFWTGGPVPKDLAGAPSFGGGAALPRRLGKFPFWRGDRDFLEALDGLYARAYSLAAARLGGGNGEETDAQTRYSAGRR